MNRSVWLASSLWFQSNSSPSRAEGPLNLSAEALTCLFICLLSPLSSWPESKHKTLANLVLLGPYCNLFDCLFFAVPSPVLS